MTRWIIKEAKSGNYPIELTLDTGDAKFPHYITPAELEALYNEIMKWKFERRRCPMCGKYKCTEE